MFYMKFKQCGIISFIYFHTQGYVFVARTLIVFILLQTLKDSANYRPIEPLFIYGITKRFCRPLLTNKIVTIVSYTSGCFVFRTIQTQNSFFIYCA